MAGLVPDVLAHRRDRHDARPEPNGRTCLFHFEGSALFGRLVKPAFAWNIRRDFQRLTSLL